MKLDKIQLNWQQLQAREKRMVGLAAGVCIAAALWTLAISPALKQREQSPIRHAQLDAQLQRMADLQVRAAELKSQPAIEPAATMATLQDLGRRLGEHMHASVVGNQASVVLDHVSSSDMEILITDMRSKGGVTPFKASLKRNGEGSWNGDLQFALPGNRSATN